MSNYGSAPPPGQYQNASQGYNPQQQQQQQQQQQGHQPAPSNYGQPSHAHKSGGAFGQIMNQAVSTGKPMFDKLGKTISSKLGNKPAAGPPQHLHSYHNYQQHNNPPGQTQGYQQLQGQNQGYQQPQGQTYSPQPQQQQQWQQPQQPPPPAHASSYTSAQPSPYQQQSNYGTPASGQSNQSNYFAQQNPPPPTQTPNPPPPNMQAPPIPQHPSTPGYNVPDHGHEQQGQQGQQGETNAGQFGGHFQQGQDSLYGSQQTGVVGGAQHAGYGQPPPSMYQQNAEAQQFVNSTPGTPAQHVQQPQWGYPPEKVNPQASPQQPYQPAPSPAYHQPEQQQHWNSMSPVSPHAQVPSPGPLGSVSPPPPQQQMNMPPLTEPPTSATQPSVPHSAPNEFIAELPADLGNLSLTQPPRGTAPALPDSQYQAYTPPALNGSSPPKGFSVPRRVLSTSSIPLADPWRFEDPMTGAPTREFYIIADLLFDALDRKFEPRNSGLLEATKVVESWIDVGEDARKWTSYKDYRALAHMWSIGNIPHIMVPVETKLAPIFNLDQNAHQEAIKVSSESLMDRSPYTRYMPALNRAGWYKAFFADVAHDPAGVDKMLTKLCSDTYKPGGLNHPDMDKRDKSEISALQVRAAEVGKYAANKACELANADMMLDANAPSTKDAAAGASTASGLTPGSPEDVAVRMHQIQMERQFNDTAVKTVLGGGITFGGGGASSGGYGSLV